LSVKRNKQRRTAPEIESLDKQYLWHPFTQMSDWEKEPQIVVESGNGSTLIDIRGKRYLDGVSSLWVTVHGHRVGEIDRAIKSQLTKIAHSTLLGLANVPSIELAERLLELGADDILKELYEVPPPAGS